jgi:hypothetical protein
MADGKGRFAVFESVAVPVQKLLVDLGQLGMVEPIINLPDVVEYVWVPVVGGVCGLQSSGKVGDLAMMPAQGNPCALVTRVPQQLVGKVLELVVLEARINREMECVAQRFER